MVDGKGAQDRELRKVTPTRSLICLHAREGSRRARVSIPLHLVQFLSVSCDALLLEHTEGMEASVPLDLNMPLENGPADGVRVV